MIRSDRSPPAEHALCADRQDAAHDARIKRSAWALAALAVAFYVGFIAWNLWRSRGGG